MTSRLTVSPLVETAGESETVEVVRSPADVLRLVVATTSLVVLLVVERLFGAAVAGFIHDLLRGLDAIDRGVVTTFLVLVRVASVVGLVVALVVALVRGRGRALLTGVVAVAAGALVHAVVDWSVDEQRAPLVAVSDVAGPLTSTQFPTTRGLAMVAAAVTAVAPWLTRRLRRVAWTCTLALAAALFLTAPVSAHALAAVLSGWAGGALAVVALGAPSARPNRAAVVAGLHTVGTDLVALEPASVDARGSTPYLGELADSRRAFVKVLGRDERDADLLFRLYRFVVPRQRGDERPFSSLRRAVEHEMLLSLSATRLGVRTPPVIAFCDAEPDAFVLAYEAVAGRSLDGVDAADITDGVLHQVWDQVAVLRAGRVAHRDLRLANVFLGADGSVWVIDFGFAELAASELLLATDVAELTVSLGTKVGATRAVAVARAALGHDAVRSALQRLRPGLLSTATRTSLKQQPALLEAIRSSVTQPGSA